MTERLSLSGWRRASYYFPLAFVLGAATLMYALSSYAFATAYVIICLWMARKLHRGRRFVCLRTNRSPIENYAKALSVIDATDWCINKSVDGEFIEAFTYPPLWKGSWSELITVKFESDRVLINSICDPDRYPSVASWGQNRKNVSLLAKAFTDDIAQPSYGP